MVEGVEKAASRKHSWVSCIARGPAKSTLACGAAGPALERLLVKVEELWGLVNPKQIDKRPQVRSQVAVVQRLPSGDK